MSRERWKIGRRSLSLARGRRASRRAVRSFILVEILVSVVILGIALASVLMSYTNALRSVSYDRRLTRAVSLAQGLLEDFEVDAPEEETVEGSFEPDFPGFRYVARFEEEEIRYRNLDFELGKLEFRPLRKVTIEIFYAAPDGREEKRMIRIESYLTGIEKYARRSRYFNALY